MNRFFVQDQWGGREIECDYVETDESGALHFVVVNEDIDANRAVWIINAVHWQMVKKLP